MDQHAQGVIFLASLYICCMLSRFYTKLPETKKNIIILNSLNRCVCGLSLSYIHNIFGKGNAGDIEAMEEYICFEWLCASVMEQ